MDISFEKEIISEKISIENLLPDIGVDNMRKEIIEGLTAEHKYISSKYFYNQEGSMLFEKITQLEEYYPTRTEKAIIESNAGKILEGISDKTIIELGSGDCSKIKLMLSALPEDNLKKITYIPVDISVTAIKDSAKCLNKTYPELKIEGVTADFLHNMDFLAHSEKKIICFFGSTIGNLTRKEAVEFLENIGSVMNESDVLLLGMDMVKDKHILEQAYNDSKGLTAIFNKNIINTINAIIKTNIDPDNFEHRAFYNERENRIEMHLLANKNMEYNSLYTDSSITFSKDEYIHTENSHKFTENDIIKFGESSGLRIKDIYQDNPNKWFSLVLFEKIV